MKTFAQLQKGVVCIVLAVVCVNTLAKAQTETAKISGVVTDSSGAVMPETEIVLENVEQGTRLAVRTNQSGIYVLSSVPAGKYRLSARKTGFKQVDVLGLIVNVQDRVEENFRLQPGSVLESVTVTADPSLLKTEDASLSTVVDRNFAENLPLNGRSFQTLIYLAPGVIQVPGGGTDSGQFTANGQQSSTNYWTVDGVSANVGSNALLSGQQMGGAIGTTSVSGGTNSLVPVDALQEFRVQTSTFAPEYGRSSGAQISIVTRSGGNSIHGSLFDYLRNDLFDANDWFNGINFLNPKPLPKARERQNDFGGTLGGAILKNKTFFFVAYEGLRLRLPATGLTSVPCDSSCTVYGNVRAIAKPSVQPFLNAFPLPNGPEVFTPCQPGTSGCPSSGQMSTGSAELNASYVNPTTLDDYSIRFDHKVNGNISSFLRYNVSPSRSTRRGVFSALNQLQVSKISAQQLTAGFSSLLSSRLLNEFRFNWSKTDASSANTLDNFHGAVPFSASQLSVPSPFSSSDTSFTYGFSLLGNMSITLGPFVRNVQRQLNITDTVSWSVRTHNLKYGLDYRRLTPRFVPSRYSQSSFFNDMLTAQNGGENIAIVQQSVNATFLLQNVSAFVQDTWRVRPQLTMTYGLRWDVNTAPTAISGPQLPAAMGFRNIDDLSQVALAPPGTPAFKTNYGNFAPRVGVSYEALGGNWGTVLKGGFGIFYNMEGTELGTVVGGTDYPYNGVFFGTKPEFPLSPSDATPPSITPQTDAQRLKVFAPNLQAPYTLEWNTGIQQGLGQQQAISVSYVGARGRRLIQNIEKFPDPSLPDIGLLANAGFSSYNAFQAQFERRLYKRLQILSAYTWSHSIDTASAGSGGVGSDSPAFLVIRQNRASSDYDIRHAVSVGSTYTLPATNFHPILNHLTRGWSLYNILQAQTARPVSVLYGLIGRSTAGLQADIRPDRVPGIPLYLYGGSYPGGKAFNNVVAPGACPDGSDRVGAFCPPPTVPSPSGVPLAVRQGNFPRNGLRGFGLFQWNLGVHRDVRIREATTLQFRAEMFNLLNHPNFGPPGSDISFPQLFGLSSQTLSNYLAGSFPGAGGLDSLYQTGGPRSMQFALKLSF